jgi:hypothetical protein
MREPKPVVSIVFMLCAAGCTTGVDVDTKGLSQPLLQEYCILDARDLPTCSKHQISTSLAGVRTNGSAIAIDVFMKGKTGHVQQMAESIIYKVESAPKQYFNMTDSTGHIIELLSAARPKSTSRTLVDYAPTPALSLSDDGNDVLAVITFVFQPSRPVVKGDKVSASLTRDWATRLCPDSVFAPNLNSLDLVVSGSYRQ